MRTARMMTKIMMTKRKRRRKRRRSKKPTPKKMVWKWSTPRGIIKPGKDKHKKRSAVPPNNLRIKRKNSVPGVKKRNLQDTKDAAAGVTYRLVLDSRLQPPRFTHNTGCTVTAVKIPTSGKVGDACRSHCAAIAYTVPPTNT